MAAVQVFAQSCCCCYVVPPPPEPQRNVLAAVWGAVHPSIAQSFFFFFILRRFLYSVYTVPLARHNVRSLLKTRSVFTPWKDYLCFDYW